MKLMTDSKSRLTSAELFRPLTAYDAKRMPDGSVRVMELVEKEVPTVRPERVNGMLRLPQASRPSRQTIVAAIRADRDER